MVDHHPLRTLRNLIGILPMSWHRSILQKIGASTNPGAVQLLIPRSPISRPYWTRAWGLAGVSGSFSPEPTVALAFAVDVIR